MHKYLIKEASEMQLREFVDDAMSMLKETHHDVYEDLESYLYKEIYGCHFSESLLKEALKNLENEDGSRGGHWTVDQTTAVAKSKGIVFTKFNEYDFNYVMNMMYSDYFGVVRDDVESYVQLALRFLNDKDAPEGKAYRYYLAMK